VWRAEPGERGHEIQVAMVGNRLRQRPRRRSPTGGSAHAADRVSVRRIG
jgi:hypothetical protein